MRFDLISDAHWDAWLEKDDGIRFEGLLPEKSASLLVVAGDISNDNKVSETFLRTAREHYARVLFVFGNHDFYLENGKARWAYKKDSMARAAEMKAIAKKIGGVVCLDGTFAEIDGIVFGGACGWYDHSYAKEELGMSWDDARGLWQKESNDSEYLFGLPSKARKMFEAEKAKIERVLPISDVVLTHYAPNWAGMPEAHKGHGFPAFDYFDGGGLAEAAKGKTWCFGHVHARCDYEFWGCRFVNASLGTPADGWKRIATIEI